MSITTSLGLLSSDELLRTFMLNEYDQGVLPTRYTLGFTSEKFLQGTRPSIFPNTDWLVQRARPHIGWWFDKGHRQWSLETMVLITQDAIRCAPHFQDIAFDVEEDTSTSSCMSPCLATSWVRIGQSALYLRLSQARTAQHQHADLRTPVMGGIALEVTSDPDSLHPAHAMTVLVYEPHRGEDPRYPWLKPRDARVFDFREFNTVPYSAGPLYGGHPNEITNPAKLEQVIALTRTLIYHTIYG